MITADAVALRAITRDVWWQVFTPPERLTVSECADRHRVLSPEYSAAAIDAGGPIPFATSDVPYIREIQDLLGEGRYREHVLVKSAQVMGSTIGENWILHTILQQPQPMLMVWPTEKKMKAFSTTRLDPMLRDCSALAAKVPKSGRRESTNTQDSKHFPGGYLQLLTAKSTSDLRSFSAGLLYAEEADEWERELRGQGNPFRMLRARAITFRQSVLFVVSSPGLEETSLIWPMYEGSTQGRYLLPCPHCNLEQPLVWKNEQSVMRFEYERDAEEQVVPGSVRFRCAGCDQLIEESWKPAMLTAGRWHYAFPHRQTCGWHVWSAYNPMLSWYDLAQEFQKSKDRPDTLQTFVNLWLGLTFKRERAELPGHVLKSRAHAYEAEVPDGARLLTCAVDVNVDWLQILKIGWGLGEELWCLDTPMIFEGNPSEHKVWQDMWAEVFRPMVHASGAELVPIAIGVDIGYLAEESYRWAMTYRNRGAFPLVGGDGPMDPWCKPPAPARFKRTRERQAAETRPAYVIGRQQIFTTLFDHRLRITPAEGEAKDKRMPGRLHFPETYEDSWFEQLSAPIRRNVIYYGRLISKWVDPPYTRMEAAALMTYNFGAWAKLGARRAEMTRGLLGVVKAAPAGAVTGSAAPRPPGPWVISKGVE